MSDIRIVVGLDFGTTYSGFAYRHVKDKRIYINDLWPGETGKLKTNTVLQYDSNFQNVEKWGKPALSRRSSRKNKIETRPVELFKLHLGNLQKDLRPKLPDGLRYKKAITDYLFELGKLIKTTIKKQWAGINFAENVLFVLTVPAEYSEKDKATMRKCVYKAELIDKKSPQMLELTTEPEAAAIYCMENILQEYGLLATETTFMIIDCGGGTVDLATHELVRNKNKPFQLGEVTERIGDFCGSTFIDEEFVEFLREKLGSHPIDLLIENHYGEYQCIIQEFCQRVKMPFTGDDMRFHYVLNIDDNENLLEYVSENQETKKIMEEKEWVIDIKYNDIKKMFDLVIDRIIRLIDIQLSNIQLSNNSNNRRTCSAMFLVGGFSENEYLQEKIKDKFNQTVKIISVPNQPIAAIARGAAIYGLDHAKFLKNPLNAVNASKKDKLAFPISTRVLKYTYGIKIIGRWKEDEHPPNRKVHNDRIYLFETFVKRGTKVEVDKEFVLKGYKTLDPNQDVLTFELLKSPEYKVKYPDELGVEPVGKLRIYIPTAYNKSIYKPAVTFGFSLGKTEITAFARNEIDPANQPKKNKKNNEKNWFFGQNFQTKFELSQDENEMDEDER